MAMTADEAFEIYDAEKGKAGRPSQKFNNARLFLIDKGLLDEKDATGKGGAEKKDKKPPLVLELIGNHMEVAHNTRVSIYMEALHYISDKRNFSFDYYLLGRYGLTRRKCNDWEMNEEIRELRTLATETTEQKLLDAVNDKYSGGNPLGNMLTLKAIYGYSDKGDAGQLKVDSDIEVLTNMTADDLVDMSYAPEMTYEREAQNEE